MVHPTLFITNKECGTERFYNGTHVGSTHIGIKNFGSAFANVLAHAIGSPSVKRASQTSGGCNHSVIHPVGFFNPKNEGVSLLGPNKLQATACIVKVVRQTESVDLLFVSGCRLKEATAVPFHAVDAADAASMLEYAEGSRALDCVLLTHQVRERLMRSGPPTAFTVPALLTLRRWAKARHVGQAFAFLFNSIRSLDSTAHDTGSPVDALVQGLRGINHQRSVVLVGHAHGVL